MENSGSQNSDESGTQVGSALYPEEGDDELQLEASQESQSQSSDSEVSKRKLTRRTSDVWDHFTRENNEALCNYCTKSFAACDGTAILLKHLKVCQQNPNREIYKKQKTVVFDQEKSQLALAKMIIVDGLPFEFVENQGFRDFMNEAQPGFKIPSPVTIASDCLQLYKDEKENLKLMLSENHQMVSLTTNTWSSNQHVNYMRVMAHFVDNEWEFKKKVLSFSVVADNKAEAIGKSLEKCLKDWGISKVCSITVDSTSANNLAVAYLARSMSWNDLTLLNGDYMHMVCCAHILNLVVSDGLKELDCSVSKIRASCKYVKSSAARFAIFESCARKANITSEAVLTIDVPTRWNSTYTMLDVAEKFEKAFTCLAIDDPFYMVALENEGGPPTFDDWSQARVFVKILRVFYDATLSFSGPLHVASNTFYHLCNIQLRLNKWMQSDDMKLQMMATNMKVIFDKHWKSAGNVNYLLFVSVFLDPCYKLEYIEFFFQNIYGEDKCKDLLKKLNEVISKLFEYYTVLHSSPLDDDDSSSDLSLSDASKRFFKELAKRSAAEHRRTELKRYMEDDNQCDISGFNVLKWWEDNKSRYAVLTFMAKDILAIPFSTVSSETAFSTVTEPVLDPFLSSIPPSTAEALICSQNWLNTPSKEIDTPAAMDEN